MTITYIEDLQIASIPFHGFHQHTHSNQHGRIFSSNHHSSTSHTIHQRIPQSLYCTDPYRDRTLSPTTAYFVDRIPCLRICTRPTSITKLVIALRTDHVTTPPILLNPNPTRLIRTNLGLPILPPLTSFLSPRDFLLLVLRAREPLMPFLITPRTRLLPASPYRADNEGFSLRITRFSALAFPVPARLIVRIQTVVASDEVDIAVDVDVGGRKPEPAFGAVDVVPHSGVELRGDGDGEAGGAGVGLVLAFSRHGPPGILVVELGLETDDARGQ